MAIALLEKDVLGISRRSRAERLNRDVFGEKVGLFASLFGCWHKRVTRPFAAGKVSYCACLDCGARKPFNVETLKSEKKFYYPPIVREVTFE